MEQIIKPDLTGLSLEELKQVIREMGEPAYRAAQVFEWIHVRCAASYDEMTNISKKLRGQLEERFTLVAPRIIRMQESAIDGTRKYLFAMADDSLVESVFMRYHHGNSVCISSQVGCRMGCTFCASTLDGLVRNLTAGEMLGQIYAITRHTGERVSNVVVMGTGEPMDNFENLVRFLRLLTGEGGLHISQRNVTVSTCGLVPKMKLLAEENFQITLALSLHAVTDEKRRKLMPVANSYSIAELMEVCNYYYKKTGRRITFEYSLVAGVNDTDEDAAGLVRLARPLGCHINLIPVNPIAESDYASPTRQRALAFQKRLEKNGINATIRREMGRDIDGACGQLRHRQLTDGSTGRE